MIVKYAFDDRVRVPRWIARKALRHRGLRGFPLRQEGAVSGATGRKPGRKRANQGESGRKRGERQAKTGRTAGETGRTEVETDRGEGGGLSPRRAGPP